MNKVLIIVVSVIVILFGVHTVRTLMKGEYQKGLNRGVSLMYRQMNQDLRTKLGIHYDVEKRTFTRLEE